jgi:hypothetical protein
MNIEERLDFTNYREHPSNKAYTVFFFKTLEQGDFFETLLQQHKLWFERFNEDELDNNRKVLFAVKNSDLKAITKLNNLAIGKYRKPFIPNKLFAWAMIVFSTVVISLAILGYLKNT